MGAALAHGFVVVAFVYTYGHISGTHINPAVTLGLLIAGEIEFVAAIGYWIVQFLGGILGAVVLKAVLPDAGDLGVTILTTEANGGAVHGYCNARARRRNHTHLLPRQCDF